MPIPATPQELLRRLSELDRELVRLENQIAEQRAAGADTHELEELRHVTRSERIRLQFFAGEAPRPGRKPRDAEGLELAKAKPGCGCARTLVMLVVVGTVGTMAWRLISAKRANERAAAVSELTAKPPRTSTASPRPPTKRTPSAPVPSAALPGPSVEVTWQAAPKKATGFTLPQGTSCKITVSLRPARGDGVHAIGAEPRITCGSLVVFPLPGTDDATPTTRVWERPGQADGQWEYWLQYAMPSQTEDSPRVLIDTPRELAIIRTTGAVPGLLELAVERWGVRQGGSSLASKPMVEPGDFTAVERQGTVSEATGQAVAVPVGARCALRLTPEQGRYDCRAHLQCGTTVLYGAGTTGFNDCGFVDGLPMTASDTKSNDGDAAFDLDLGKGSIVVRGLEPPDPYRIAIKLEP